MASDDADPAARNGEKAAVPGGLHRQPHVLPRRQPVEEGRRLERPCQPQPSAPRGARSGDVLVLQRDPSAGRAWSRH